MTISIQNDGAYEPDTPEAILQCAVAVACVDGEFAYGEQERVRSVYEDICQEMALTYSRLEVSDVYENISQTTSATLFAMDNLNERLGYIEECGQLITEKDLRELTLVVALRIAGGDAELHNAEFDALKSLANRWRIKLSDILEPYLA